MVPRTRRTPCLILLASLGGCGERSPVPTAPVEVPPVVRSEIGPTIRWNRVATDLFRLRGGAFNRTMAYVSLAQYRAVLSAWGGTGVDAPSIPTAVGSASAAVLKHFFPRDAAAIDGELADQMGGPKWGDENSSLGVQLGRSAGVAVLALAATDNYGATSPGLPPLGPGYWVSSGAPLERGNLGARPFFLASQYELRPGPPPAFGSPDFLAALSAVRQYSDARTQAQVALSQKWMPFSGPLFHDLARELIIKYKRSELETSRILAYASTAAFDAVIACFDTKYAYWLTRPTQSDSLITTAVALTNDPSYPSMHSCEAGAYQVVLGDAFPAERDMLAAVAGEASLSRIMGGLHYPFDGDVGLEIGRAAGALALARRNLER